jgi:hypothetical protein|nr:MAG TPA: hypothetical protein [Caudoviricetes sp.]
MSSKKEYRVGEIFRRNGETFQCVRTDPGEGVYCLNCEAVNQLCETLICHEKERSDKKNAHFIRVTEQEDGMLFRASDGVLYELKKLENRGCGCYRYGYMACSEIDEEAFGEATKEEFHWYPVEEKKETGEEMIDYSKLDLEKVRMNRHLELAVVKHERGQVIFRVAEWSHRYFDFCKDGSNFKAKNGVEILLASSCYAKSGVISTELLFDYITPDCEEYKCDYVKFIEIMEAVNEYNETNGRGYEKPWPQNGDKYLCIDSAGCINEYDYDNDYMDEVRRELGNFFRTRDEAEAALERVKKALKGE